MHNDLIRRQDVIKAIDKHSFDTTEGLCLDNDITCILEEIPSAQPEIIQCRDCKWCEEKNDSFDKSLYWMCRKWDGETDGDGFCYDAERRTDE